MTRAQSTFEYAVFICLIVAALVSMTVYIKRGVQGNIRASAGQLSDGLFYAPGATEGNSTMVRAIHEQSSTETVEGATKDDADITTTNSTSTFTHQRTKTENLLPFASGQ